MATAVTDTNSSGSALVETKFAEALASLEGLQMSIAEANVDGWEITLVQQKGGKWQATVWKEKRWLGWTDWCDGPVQAIQKAIRNAKDLTLNPRPMARPAIDTGKPGGPTNFAALLGRKK